MRRSTSSVVRGWSLSATRLGAATFPSNSCHSASGQSSDTPTSPFRASETKIARDLGELYAELPLGASNAQRLMADRGLLRTDTKLVGSVALSAGSTVSEYDLVGPECRRATHVIGALYVGGFAMAAGNATTANGATSFPRRVRVQTRRAKGTRRSASAPIRKASSFKVAPYRSGSPSSRSAGAAPARLTASPSADLERERRSWAAVHVRSEHGSNGDWCVRSRAP